MKTETGGPAIYFSCFLFLIMFQSPFQAILSSLYKVNHTHFWLLSSKFEFVESTQSWIKQWLVLEAYSQELGINLDVDSYV